MRRLKRDPLERAFLRGYQNGITGKSRDLCPFTHPTTRQPLSQDCRVVGWVNGQRSRDLPVMPF
ncbi:ribosome modulation factor [Morganella morganii]